MTTIASSPALNPLVGSSTSRGANIAAWVLQVLLALALGAAGVAKLAGAEQMVANFQQLGFGQWFRILTGALEVLGAIGLLIPHTSFYAAILLGTVMLGAALSHVAITGGSPMPAVFLLALCGTVTYLRRP